MKRKRIVISALAIFTVILAAIIFFVFFHRKEESDILWTSNWLGCRWFNGNGAFEYDGSLLYYYNPRSSKRMVACSKAGCQHKGEDCPAYGQGMLGVTFTSTGLIYFAQISDRVDMYGLYQIDSDGSNLRELHRFRDVGMIEGDIKYDGNRVWFSYLKLTDGEGNQLAEPEAGIVGYDLDSGKEKRVFAEQKVAAHISALACCGSELYFLYRYSDMTRKEALEHAEDDEYAQERQRFTVAAVSADGGDYRIISDKIVSTNCLSVLENTVYFCREDGVYAYDAKNQTTSQVKKGSFEMISAYGDQEQGLLLRDMQSSPDHKEYWYWDHGTFRKISGGKEVCLSVNGDYAWFMNEEGEWMVADTAEFLDGKKLALRSF